MSPTELYCYFAYLGPFFIAGLFSEASGSRRFRFHANQGLLLFIAEVIFVVVCCVINKPLRSVPYVGPFLFYLIAAVFVIISFVFSAKGMMNVAKGQDRPLPVIGKLTLIRH